MCYQKPSDLDNWSLLNNELMSLRHKVILEWQELVVSNAKEEQYQKFLSKQAGMFFLDAHSKFICIEKIRLGADYVIDFAVVTEGYSNGLSWELIEIELPHAIPFTKEGIPSARLSRAIQQIHNWKRWLIDNRRDAEKLFPAYGIRTKRNANFKFSVLIGTRDNSSLWIEQREQLSTNLGIELLSFDRLTEWLERRWFSNKTFIDSSSRPLTEWQKKYLANPFAMAMSDKEWRKFLKERIRGKIYGAHFTPTSAELLLKYRSFNKELLTQFQSASAEI